MRGLPVWLGLAVALVATSSVALELDTDSNGKIDVFYGGTNAGTAGDALDSLGAEPAGTAATAVSTHAGDAAAHHTATVDTNANTVCTGTTTYLDGEGGCDNLATTYQAAAVRLTEFTQLAAVAGSLVGWDDTGTSLQNRVTSSVILSGGTQGGVAMWLDINTECTASTEPYSCCTGVGTGACPTDGLGTGPEVVGSVGSVGLSTAIPTELAVREAITAVLPLPVAVVGSNYTLGTTDPREVYGGRVVATASMTLALPTAVSGYSACLYAGQGVTAALSVLPAAGDYLVVAGVRGTVATALTSTGGAGDRICAFVAGADDWYIESAVGNWAE